MNNIDLYLQELETSKVDIKEAIIAKGVTPTGGLSSYAAAINDIEGSGGGPIETDDLGVLINENGSYYYTPEGDGFTSVSVTVDVITPPVITQEKDVTITSNGDTIVTPDEGFDGLNKVNISVDVPIPTFETETLTVELTDNGTYNYTPEKDGYSSVEVSVDVPIPTFETETLTVELTDNGTYNYTPEKDGYSSVEVSVDVPIPTFETETLTVELTDNGTYNYTPTVDGYNVVNISVDVPTGGGDTGKPKIYNGFQFTGGDIAKVDFSEYDWSGVYDTGYFFEKCSHSTGDWSNFLENYNGKILSGHYMFKECTSLTSIPQLDTSKVTDMSNMFYSCRSLTSIPQLDTSNVANMSYMFQNCRSLTSIPQLDTSKVTDMSNMFNNCGSLTSIPQLDTSNVANMYSMFIACANLTSLPKFYCGKISSGNNINIFYNNTMNNLTDLGGFEDLGKSPGFNNKPSAFLKNCPNLTKEAVMNVINNLYDRKSAGYSDAITLLFNTKSLALLSDDEKAIATNKGWILATS